MVKEISAAHLFIKKKIKIEPQSSAIQGLKKGVALNTLFC
jgi:hypothetical protein